MLDGYTSELRKGYIGSSDAAAILGLDPWRSAYDVWASKTGRLRVDIDSVPMLLGRYLEPAVLSWCEDRLETALTRDVFRAIDHRCANFDAVAFDLPAVIEAKTVGLIARPGYHAAFGGEGTDELPDHIVVQVQHQLAVAAAQDDWPAITVAHVPVLLAGVGFVLYRVERNDALIATLTEAEARFWRDHVEANVPPQDVLPSMDTMRHLAREPDVTAELAPEVVATWLEARANERAAKSEVEIAQRRVLAALGDAEVGTCALGSLTYRQQTRAEHVVPASTFRVARWKAAAGEKGSA